MSDFIKPPRSFQEKINDQLGRFSGESKPRSENSADVPRIFNSEELKNAQKIASNISSKFTHLIR